MRLNSAVLCILSSMMCVLSLSAQESYKAKLVTESLLLDIELANDELIVVGERGHILLSTDGENWRQEIVPTLATLTALSVVGDKHWVVGHDAVILHKASKSADWEIQMYQPDLERPFLDVLFFDAAHGIAIGAYGTFYRTLDSGQTWSSETHPEFLSIDDQEYLAEIKLEDEAFYLEELASILPHLNRLSQSGDRLYLAGEAGLLATSEDLGRTWQRLEINYQGSFFDARETPSGRLLAAGLRGNLFEFNRNENRWNKLRSQSQVSLNSIVNLYDNEMVVVGNNGTLVCLDANDVKKSQTQDKEAISNAIFYNQKIIAVTAAGIKTIQPKSELGTCAKESNRL